MREALFENALEDTRHTSGKDAAHVRRSMKSGRRHYGAFYRRKGQLTRVRASERKGIRSSTASSSKRTEGGKSSKGCSGTAHRARKKRPFRPFRDRRVRHLISLSLTGRYFSVLRFLTLFYLYTRGKTNPLPSLNRHVRRPFWKKGLISGIAFRSEYKVRMCNANLFPRKRLTQNDVLFGRAVKH